MADTALKLAQIGLEGPYTSGSSQYGVSSVYNAGTAVPATRRLAMEKGMGAEFKYTWDAPQEARGTYAGSYQHVLEMVTASGKIPAIIYCDDLCWYGRMALSGTPTVTTLPATPFTAPNLLLAATATSITTTALTTQPGAVTDGAACKILAVQLSAASVISTAVNITIVGTDPFNKSITEILYFTKGVSTQSASMNTTGSPSYFSTLYTQNYFKTVTSFTSSVATAGQSAAVGGVNGFLWVFGADMATSTLYSATMEYWDGSAAWQVPGCVLEKFGLQMQIGKSFKLDTTFLAQQKTPLAASAAVVPASNASNPNAVVGSINSAAQAGTYNALQALKDNPAAAIASYKASVYADPNTNAPGTTQIPARLIDFKVDVEVGAKLGKAADGTPYPSFVGRQFYKVTGEMTMLFNSYVGTTADPAELVQFLQANSRLVRVALPGAPLPCGTVTGTTGWPSQLPAGSYGMLWDMYGKYTEVTEKDVEGRAAFAFKFESEVDLIQLGTQSQLTVVSRISPNQL